MKIWVEHEVSNHPYSCLYSDGTFMEGRTVCKYHKFLTQTHGRKCRKRKQAIKGKISDEQ